MRAFGPALAVAILLPSVAAATAGAPSPAGPAEELGMDLLGVETLGILAGTLTTASFLPQVWKAWRTRRVRDISLGMFVAFCTGLAIWIAYGIGIGSWPVILTNVVTLVLAGAILVMKLLWDRAPTEEPEAPAL